MGSPSNRAFFSGVIALTVGGPAIMTFFDPQVPWEVTALLGAVTAPFALYSVACVAIPNNIGREPSHRHRLARLCGYSVRGCGCTYSVTLDRFGTNSTAPEATTVESETVWLRSEENARIQFWRAETGLKRCHRCGHHYHFTKKKEADWRTDKTYRHECWPEEEPDVREQLHRRIVSEEVESDE